MTSDLWNLPSCSVFLIQDFIIHTKKQSDGNMNQMKGDDSFLRGLGAWWRIAGLMWNVSTNSPQRAASKSTHRDTALVWDSLPGKQQAAVATCVLYLNKSRVSQMKRMNTHVLDLLVSVVARSSSQTQVYQHVAGCRVLMNWRRFSWSTCGY